MIDRLRIGIDGRVLGVRPKGIGRYIWELCKALDVILPCAEFYLYTRESTGLPRISNRWHERAETGLAQRLPKSLWAITRPGFMARRDRVDVFWGGTGFIPLIGLSARSVLSVHDLVYKLMPESMSRRARWAMKMFFEASLSRANMIVTNSQGTADRLRAIMGYEAAAIVRPGLSSAFTPQTEAKIAAILKKYSIRPPYVLGVGTLEPRKGLDLLVRAFLSSRSKFNLTDHTLVLAGDRGWRDRSLARLLKGSSPRVTWLGFIDDDELVTLYSGCEVFVYPSKYEGFGMPVLEARACGARVVTTDSPELREAGGTDAIYVDSTEDGIIGGITSSIKSVKNGAFDWRKQSWIGSSTILAKALTGQDLDQISIGGSAGAIGGPEAAIAR
jgi:glycosyltransferase involved in cell wall biosynthesis